MQAPSSRLTLRTGLFALSVDVEDYFQVWAFSDVVRRDSWASFEFRAGETTRACLDLLDRSGAKATFFTLGWIAERDRALVREIARRGHELASHGFHHEKVHTLSREAFIEDISTSKKLLEDIAGIEVKGYRAPGFSIGPSTPWAYDALIQAGYRYSSSAHPIAHDHYGDPEAPQGLHFPVSGSTFIEAPVATTSLLGRRVSCAGGGWFRAMPTAVSKALLRKAAHEVKGPVIFYFHPWEIDAGQPHIEKARLTSKLRHYLNIEKNHNKLVDLLGSFLWGRIDEHLCVEALRRAA